MTKSKGLAKKKKYFEYFSQPPPWLSCSSREEVFTFFTLVANTTVGRKKNSVFVYLHCQVTKLVQSE